MRQCKVMLHGRFVGTLVETDSPKEYVFKYEDAYIREGGKEPVCLAMPVREEEYRSDVLFPFFSNMLSEGENRAVQASMLHIDIDDDFGFLIETARHDTVGAVTVS